MYEHRVKIFQPNKPYFLALPFGGFSDCTLENKGSQPLTHHLLSKKSMRFCKKGDKKPNDGKGD